MSVVRRKKASVSKRKTAPPAKKKRYKTVSPRSTKFTRPITTKGGHYGWRTAEMPATRAVVKGKRKPFKKIYNALDLEMKRKTASQPAPNKSERLYIKFSRKGKKESQ